MRSVEDTYFIEKKNGNSTSLVFTDFAPRPVKRASMSFQAMFALVGCTKTASSVR